MISNHIMLHRVGERTTIYMVLICQVLNATNITATLLHGIANRLGRLFQLMNKMAVNFFAFKTSHIRMIYMVVLISSCKRLSPPPSLEESFVSD